MSNDIPSLLKLLIDKRARIDAEIKNTRISLAKAKQLIKGLSELGAILRLLIEH